MCELCDYSLVSIFGVNVLDLIRQNILLGKMPHTQKSAISRWMECCQAWNMYLLEQPSDSFLSFFFYVKFPVMCGIEWIHRQIH